MLYLVIVATLALWALHIRAVIQNQRAFKISDPTNIFVAVVAMYLIFPAIFFELNGYFFAYAGESRLERRRPSPSDVWDVYSVALCFFATFVLASTKLTGWKPKRRRGPPTLRVTDAQVMAVAVMYVATSLIALAINQAYGLQGGDKYAEFYTRLASAPVLIQQIYGHNHWILYLCKVGVLIALAARKRFRTPWTIGFIAFEIGVNASFIGSRRDFFTVALAALIVWDMIVRRVGLARTAAVGGSMMAVFILAGFARATLMGGLSAGWNDLFATTSEFTAVFVTASDINLLERQGALQGLRQIVLTDFLSIIPQQLLPFAKTTPANWYMANIYPEAGRAGLGFAFGVVAESLTGFRHLEAIARGLVVAGIFHVVRVYVWSGRMSIWKLCLWVFFAVTSYNIYRVGTFYQLPMVVFQYVPFALAGLTLSWVLQQALGRSATGDPPSLATYRTADRR